MPWTPDEFRRKHWKNATRAQAAHAARIAEGILRGGGEESTAIATGISRAKTHTARQTLKTRAARKTPS